MHQYSHIIERCFVNAPFPRLQTDLLPLFLEHRIRPEIGLEGAVLYDTPRPEFEAIASRLKKAGLACTLHAPFLDLVPGSLDREIRRASRAKLRLAFELIELFEPVSIVCHLGYEPPKHGPKRSEWLKHATETWQELLEISSRHRTPMMLENTFETDPQMHLDLLKALDSPYARFCLDVGHVMAFAGNTWQDWLPALQPYLGQLHLHDNDGSRDAHLAVGEGVFDFAALFAYLREQELSPVITLEPHHEEGLFKSLANLATLDHFPREAANR